MRNVIHKQPLKYDDCQVIETGGWVSRLLSVQLQNDIPTLWYIVDLDADDETRTKIEVYCVGTGHEPPNRPGVSYAGTTVEPPYVWHWFVR